MKKYAESRLRKLEEKGSRSSLPLVTLVQCMDDPGFYEVGQTVVGRFEYARVIDKGGQLITADQAQTYAKDHGVDVIRVSYALDGSRDLNAVDPYSD